MSSSKPPSLVDDPQSRMRPLFRFHHNVPKHHDMVAFAHSASKLTWHTPCCRGDNLWVGPVVCATGCGFPRPPSESKSSDLSANQSLSSSSCSQRTALGCMSNADDCVCGEVCSRYVGHLAAFRSRGIYAVLGKKLLRPPPPPLWDIKSGRTWS